MTSPVPSDATPACAPGAVDQERAFSVVNAAFSSLGRICMALDADFRIRYASDLLTSLLGADAAGEVRGLSIESLLGPELFGVEGPFRQALVAGEKRSANARAATDCRIVEISEKRFLFLVQQTPFFALEVMRVLAARLRRHDPHP